MILVSSCGGGGGSSDEQTSTGDGGSSTDEQASTGDDGSNTDDQASTGDDGSNTDDQASTGDDGSSTDDQASTGDDGTSPDEPADTGVDGTSPDEPADTGVDGTSPDEPADTGVDGTSPDEPASTGPCSINSNNNSVSRIVTVTVDCADARWLKLSETSDFGESATTSTVNVDINTVAPDNTYADISITYPGGVAGSAAEPFHVQPASKEVNVLAVRYVFEDSNGNIAGAPGYMTDTWLDRIVFGESVGFDGQPTANSIKKHIEHNTYGRVQIVGETYPDLIRLPLERYFDPLDQTAGNRNVLEGITDYIAANDPQFFSGKAYDFVAGFSPEHYTVIGSLEALSWGKIGPPPSHPSIKGYIFSQAPITSSSILYGEIVDESVTSVSASTLATSYDASKVTGVWLASDPTHSGTNYFTGGKLVGSRGNRHLELGTALPEAQTATLVTYTPSATHKISPSFEALFPPDALILPHDRWYARYMHEVYHSIGSLISFNGLKMGDLYKAPARLEKYDVMDQGHSNQQLDDLLGDGVQRTYYEPGYLSGYSKLASEFVFPHTLTYGHNENSIRLFKAEEADFSNTNERTKLIKVPLRPRGDPGLQNMLDLGRDRQYDGEEFLLLEWRYRGPLEGSNRNFDRYLPSEELIITHVIQNPHYHGTNSTGFGFNIVRIVDATPTPLQEEGYTDTADSPASFGHGSGVYTYQAGAYWQQMATGQGDVDYLLSEGTGYKTLYARLKDDQGNLVGQQQFEINLEDNSTAEDRIPSMAIISPGDNSVLANEPTRVSINVDAPNEVVRTFVYHDGVEIFDTSGDYQVNFIRFDEHPGDGFHSKKFVGYDRSGIAFTETLPFYILQGPASNLVPLADAGKDQSISDANSDGMVTAVLDSRESSDPDGIITGYEWYDDSGTLLSTKSVYALRLIPGTHNFTLQVKDNLGDTSTDSVSITVLAS